MATRALAGERPRAPSTGTRPSGDGRYLLSVVAVLLVMALLGSAAWPNEFRFFTRGNVVGASGDLPVPQEDRPTPALDESLRQAALRLNRGATCVIAYDSWRREYFRASYLLMPRRVWPAVVRADQTPITAQVLSAALAAHGAGCLLTPPGTAVPAGLRRLTSGAISLYVRPGFGL